MTTEEAIKILDHKTYSEAISEIEYYAGFCGEQAKAAAVIEACNMAITALRAHTDFNGAYVSIEWLKQVEAERDALKEKLDGIVHCRNCKHLYAKDMSAYCPYRVGLCIPDGFCDRGVQGG